MRKYISILFIIFLGVSNVVYADRVMTPEKILPAGVEVTESVNPYTGEAVNNIVALNKLLQEKPSAEINKEIDKISQAIIEALPSLKVIGIFNLFTPQEWLGNYQKQPGRVLTAIYYLQKYPQEVSPEIKTQLIHIGGKTGNRAIKVAIAKLLKALPNECGY